ncbi:MAG TPA: hypothetical protein VK453_20715 [Micromonosporaceae bacterium]|nr:hypothetical protein [Micromonosporaceae bacterium]
MRHVLRLISTRYGIALALCAVLLLVIGAFRGVAGSTDAEPPAPLIATSSQPSVDPSAVDDGEVEHVDPPAPSLSAGAPDPATVATKFAEAWLRHTGVSADRWLADLTPYATQALVAKLGGVDPAGVPADRMTGGVSINARDPALMEASIPVDSGTLRLRLLADKGRWRVDGVDWERQI